MRVRNSNRINRLRNQQAMVLPIVISPVFVLVLIRLGLEEVTTAEKMVFRLTLHIEKINGNANFPTTSPTTGSLQLLIDDLSHTATEINGGDLSKIPHRETLMLQSENAIRLLSYDIQKQSAGDPEKIQSAGFEVRKGRSAAKPVGQVLKLKSKTFVDGKIKLSWGKVPYSRMNFIDVTSNPVAGPWAPMGKTGRSSIVFTGLNPGQMYYFRVYGSNNLGDGEPGGPIGQRSL